VLSYIEATCAQRRRHGKGISERSSVQVAELNQGDLDKACMAASDRVIVIASRPTQVAALRHALPSTFGVTLSNWTAASILYSQIEGFGEVLPRRWGNAQ
jgi:hypothetical protein